MLRAIIWCAVSTKSQTDDDKISLPQQEQDARALAEHESWQVVDVLRVPGHSRDYIDIHECAADMRSQGIDAFDRLLDHWRARDFDVLIVRDGDRFARSQAMHAYVTERTIQVGARLYVLSSAMWVDQSNAALWTAFDGLKASSEMNRLQELFQRGQSAKLPKGVAMGATPIFGYIDVRDPSSGKRVGLRLDPKYARLWQDAAEVFLAGTSWQRMGQVLYEKYGHVNPDTSKPFHSGFFAQLFHTPAFWGNSARKYRKGGLRRSLWCFDPAAPPPKPEAEIARDTHEPVYQGDLAARIQAEMRHRADLRGNASAADPYRFSGLLICASCAHRMAGSNRAHPRGTPLTYRCRSQNRLGYAIVCRTDPQFIREIDVQAWLDARLRELVSGIDAFAVDTPEPSGLSVADQIAALETEIVADEDALARLVLRAAQTTEPTLIEAYNRAMSEATALIDAKRTRLHELQRQQPSAAMQHDQRRAHNEITKLSVDAFWELSDREINQLLRRLLGDLRIAVLDGEIAGIIDSSKL